MASPHARDEQSDVFDLVFAGGGAAACITAGRLAAADPSLRILLLERGGHTENMPQVYVPAFYMQNLYPGATTTHVHMMNSTEHVGDRQIPLHVGRCVGGGSSVNWMMYNRASASDYNDWKDVYGNDGWGFKDLAPFFKKAETYQIGEGLDTHGYSGPLKVSHGNFNSNFTKQFISTVAKYDPSHLFTEDPMDFNTVNKWHRVPKWIDQTTGRRSDVASNYVYTQKANTNLVIRTDATVTRVLFEGTRAVGVEYEYRDPSDVTNVQLRTVRAAKLVVVSAGTLGSPGILERSGIGAKDVLARCDIEQLVDLPGVGKQYQDHQMAPQMMAIDDSAETIDFAHRADQDGIAAAMKEFSATGTGLLTTNGLASAIKFRPSAEELQGLSPLVQKYFEEEFAGKPDKCLVLIGGATGSPLYLPGWPNVKMSLLGGFLHYPVSRGHAHIKSKNTSEPLDFQSGFLDNQTDIELHTFIYKKTREFGRRHPMYRGEVKQAHPSFPVGSKAAVREIPDTPVAVDAPDLTYTEEDDKAIEKWIRLTVISNWHGLGTCAMKPREQGGVVDSRLNVYGTQALKVIDLSIAPGNVGANTLSTVTAIAEKAAADIVAKELGITLSA